MWWRCLTLLGALWAQHKFLVLARLEGEAAREGVICFTQGGRTIRLPIRIEAGQAQTTWPAGWQGPALIRLEVPGYLPVRLAAPVSPSAQVLDFTQPENLDSASGFVVSGDEAYLAAGDLGALPDERYPTINAYDLELFYLAHQSQDLRADFNGDRIVDEKDLSLLLKNQNQLLQSRL